MKINPDQLLKLLNKETSVLSGALLFGPDQGLIAETISLCIEKFAGKPANPFMLSELSPTQLKAAPGLLYDELNTLPMLGEKKIVVFRHCADSYATDIKSALSNQSKSCFLLTEAGELPARSKLRKVFEENKNAAAVGCYFDDKNKIRTLIDQVFKEHQSFIDPDASLILADRLGNDRLISRNEIEKLALFVGHGGRARVNDVAAIIGDHSLLSLEGIVFDTADGNSNRADQSTARALSEGVSPIKVLRALQNHFQRLHEVIGQINRGVPLNTALGKLTPPIFFKVKPRFQQQCQQWSLKGLNSAMSLILGAERQCKKTGAPAHAICQRLVLVLARLARRSRQSETPTAAAQVGSPIHPD